MFANLVINNVKKARTLAKKPVLIHASTENSLNMHTDRFPLFHLAFLSCFLGKYKYLK